MNAISMIEACCRGQAMFVLLQRCDCGEPITASVWRCATCVVKAEIELVTRRAA